MQQVLADFDALLQAIAAAAADDESLRTDIEAELAAQSKGLDA